MGQVSRRMRSNTTTQRYLNCYWASSLEACNSRSEEHTSELQSQSNLVCRLLLEKKKCDLARPRGPFHTDPCSTIAKGFRSQPPRPRHATLSSPASTCLCRSTTSPRGSSGPQWIS